MRILLFLATNMAIMAVVTVVMSIFGFQGFLDESGVHLNLTSMLIFCGMFGMGGSFVSLLMSKWLAKRSTRAQVIDTPSSEIEHWLINTVSVQAREAGIGMPEVAIYGGQEINAFATGANRNKALVAVSAGLLQNMSRDEAEAVLAHEVAHVANGDMITLTLVQGVVNTFVMFFARVVGHVIDRVVLKNERGHGIGFYISVFVLEMIFGILASLIVRWFSRYREFRADEGGAKLAGRQKMIAALERLQSQHEPRELPDALNAFGISGGKGLGLKALFSTHPPLADRIEALKRGGAF